MSAESGNGARKAAAFLLSLDKNEAARVLASLDETVLNEVASAMSELDEEFESAEAVEGLYTELAKRLSIKQGVKPAKDDELLERLSTALGADRGRQIVADIHARRLEQRPFAELESRAPEKIAAALADESPSAKPTADTPPTILFHSADDRVVKLVNPMRFYAACKDHGVPAELKVYPFGGHGYGMWMEEGEHTAWPSHLEEWLVGRGLARR